MAPGRALGAQPKRATRDAEVVDQHEEIARWREGGIGAQRRERRAAAVHEGHGLQDADRNPVHLALGDAGPLAAPEGGEPPALDQRVGQPESRVVPRRRVLWPRAAEADHGAPASALFAALRFLGLVGFLALGRRGTALGFGLGPALRLRLGPALGPFFARFLVFAHLAD